MNTKKGTNLISNLTLSTFQEIEKWQYRLLSSCITVLKVLWTLFTNNVPIATFLLVHISKIYNTSWLCNLCITNIHLLTYTISCNMCSKNILFVEFCADTNADNFLRIDFRCRCIWGFGDQVSDINSLCTHF